MKEERRNKEEPNNSKELVSAEVLLRDAPINSVEEVPKSQKKGVFSFRSAHSAKKDSKEERPKQDDSKNKDVAVCQKVKTILQAFSANHEIFWFRYTVFLYLIKD